MIDTVNYEVPEWYVFHVPHDSQFVPKGIRNQFVLSDTELQDELLRMTDHHTLDLFTQGVPLNQVVHSKVSRLVLDVERFADDNLESMNSVGMGAIYTRTHSGRELRCSITEEQRKSLLSAWYYPHHDALTNTVGAALEKFGKCLVLDCHSFPTIALPYELDQSTDRPQFCIGTDPYHTPIELAEGLANKLSELGFTVKINSPFAGALVPLPYYMIDKRVSSVMIEVRRDLYMDESSAEKLEQFSAVSFVIRRAIASLS
jgi:N-formylglutamate deformylase